jgi:hypothetical protein
MKRAVVARDPVDFCIDHALAIRIPNQQRKHHGISDRYLIAPRADSLKRDIQVR